MLPIFTACGCLTVSSVINGEYNLKYYLEVSVVRVVLWGGMFVFSPAFNAVFQKTEDIITLVMFAVLGFPLCLMVILAPEMAGLSQGLAFIGAGLYMLFFLPQWIRSIPIMLALYGCGLVGLIVGIRRMLSL